MISEIVGVITIHCPIGVEAARLKTYRKPVAEAA